MIGHKGEYTPRIQMMLAHGRFSSQEIAKSVGCSSRLVRHVRLQMDLPHRHESIARQLARLKRELGEIRRYVLLHLGESDEREAPQHRLHCV